MKFTSPARRNYIKTPDEHLLEILVATMASSAFLDEIDIPHRRFPSGRFH
jgi:hypothetical protein